MDGCVSCVAFRRERFSLVSCSIGGATHSSEMVLDRFLTYISRAATSNGSQTRSKQSHCFSLSRLDLWAAIVSEGSESGL